MFVDKWKLKSMNEQRRASVATSMYSPVNSSANHVLIEISLSEHLASWRRRNVRDSDLDLISVNTRRQFSCLSNTYRFETEMNNDDDTPHLMVIATMRSSKFPSIKSTESVNCGRNAMWNWKSMLKCVVCASFIELKSPIIHAFDRHLANGPHAYWLWWWCRFIWNPTIRKDFSNRNERESQVPQWMHATVKRRSHWPNVRTFASSEQIKIILRPLCHRHQLRAVIPFGPQ